eukprot:GHRQ01021260.1.p1 GENE.GHRQ01021260.1~~GHRQ01021260.1.p1  ORF type:complete len:171 (+),score=41.97 GHRQ01021260.1:151-663(+)
MGKLTLHYFDFPGRAEPARLMLTLSGVEFTDKRFTYAEWPDIQPSMPFHQVPVLELSDGRILAQMAAIDRYCASLTGMLPADALTLAQVEQGYFFMNDIWEPIATAMTANRNPEASEEDKAKAWQQLLQPEGLFKQRLGLLDRWLVSCFNRCRLLITACGCCVRFMHAAE